MLALRLLRELRLSPWLFESSLPQAFYALNALGLVDLAKRENIDSAEVQYAVAFDDKHRKAVKEIGKKRFKRFGLYIVPRNADEENRFSKGKYYPIHRRP